MSNIYGPGGTLPPIPDDLTIAQFILDAAHVSRPQVVTSCLIDDSTGRKTKMDEVCVRIRTRALAQSLKTHWDIVNLLEILFLERCLADYPVAVWAVHLLGGIVTAANPAYTTGELEHQLVTTEAKLMIVHPASYAVALRAASTAGLPMERIILIDSLKDANSRPHHIVQELITEGYQHHSILVESRFRPGEGRTRLAFLSFSSGTTGKAKAVCIPHCATIAAVIQLAHLVNSQPRSSDERKIRPGDVWLAHIYGLVVMMHFAFFYGGALIVVPRFNFVEMLKSIERYRVNVLPVVPPQVVLLCKHSDVKNYDLRSIRLLISGAAPLSAELITQLSQILPSASIGQGYGMTEVVGSIAFPQMEQKIGTPGSAGRLVPGMIARVVHPDGTIAKIGEPGHLLISGPATALGYLKNEEATKETFIDGWVHTGDEVIINEQSEIFILDRIKELLKVKGYQVAPAELEGHLLDHPDVADVCVVGLPDDYSGELPLAFVVPSTKATERIKRDPAEAERVRAVLMKHVADAKVHYKRLAGGVEFVESIPKNPSGKLLRRVLRERAREMQKQGKLSSKPRAKL
ncbi:hypothetical protein IEO21_08558 [Rhodonia placenta]|uniref:Acetyl-CoA synthetase-like protein n=1 Tax=Rhodonia placenta TaxID=104341 RepID=A0A8H7NW98_9APHY|nr:hypothetical protein IEO21_08558 [Postia placenta]